MDDAEEKEFIKHILKLTDDDVEDINRSSIAGLIKKYESKPMGGVVRNWVLQLEGLLDIPDDETHAFKDLRPDLDANAKLMMIRDTFEKFLNNEFREGVRLYKYYTKYLIVDLQKIEVEEVCREDFGFILYRTVNGEDYYLDVLVNQSFAYWSENCKLLAADAEAFLKKPNYLAALSLLGKHKRK
jgi:hypothetical protein